MKSQFLLLISLFGLATATEGQIMFQQMYAANGAHDVLQTPDGGYFFLGSISLASSELCYFKTDVDGNFSWGKAISRGMFENAGVSAQQTTVGGFVIAGYSFNTVTGYDVYLIKTNSNGDTLWTKTLGGAYEDKGYFVDQTIDDGYIIIGETNSFGAGNKDIYLIKTDSMGNSIWAKTFGGIGFDYGKCVRQTSDSGYILTGYTFFGSGIYDVYLIKTDANGDSLWTKTFGGNEVDQGNSVQETLDGGFIIVGSTKSFGAGNNDVYLIKTNSIGDTLWTRNFGGTGEDYGFSVHQTDDSGLVICGALQSAFNTDVYLIRTDINGDSVWTRTYGENGSSGLDYGADAIQTLDGGFVISGYSQFLGGGSENAYLIKTDANGNSGCNDANSATTVSRPATHQTNPPTIVSSPNTIASSDLVYLLSGGYGTTLCSTLIIRSDVSNPELDVRVYPNPSIGAFTIASIQSSIILVDIFNILGKKVARIQSSAGSSELDIDVGALNSGIYFVKVETEAGTSVQKLIKQ